MVAETEQNRALEAGARFKPAIQAAHYDYDKDELILETRWGKLAIPRAEIGIFKDVKPENMCEIYASHTGVHIDDIDLDVNSAGLLTEVFRHLGLALESSF